MSKYRAVLCHHKWQNCVLTIRTIKSILLLWWDILIQINYNVPKEWRNQVYNYRLLVDKLVTAELTLPLNAGRQIRSCRGYVQLLLCVANHIWYILKFSCTSFQINTWNVNWNKYNCTCFYVNIQDICAQLHQCLYKHILCSLNQLQLQIVCDEMQLYPFKTNLTIETLYIRSIQSNLDFYSA